MTGPGFTIIVVDTSAQHIDRKIITNCIYDHCIEQSRDYEWQHTDIEWKSTLCGTETRMKPSTADYTTTQVNKVGRIVVEEWLPY